MNLIPESIENAAESTRAFMYGRPGLKFFAQVTPTDIRAMWAGGGRLFVIHHDKQTEVHEDGSQTTASQTLAFEPALPGPAQIFSNGHQLMIVSGGKVYCNNGLGPELCYFQLAGMALTFPNGLGHTNTNVLTRDSGPAFTVAMVGGPITINGRQYTVTSVSDTDHMLISPFAPTETGVKWTFTGTTITNYVLTRTSGDAFVASMAGKTITVNGRNYTVAAFTDADHINVSPYLPIEGEVPWNIAGGDEVTAITGCYLDGYGIINRPWNPPAPGGTIAGLSGTVTTDGTASVVWSSGDQFTPSVAGKTIVISGVNYGIFQYVSPMQVLVDPPPPAGSARPYSIALGTRQGRSGAVEDPGRQFNISGLNDFTFWNPIDFGIKEGRSDYLRSVNADHEQLILNGTESTEIWQNVGSQVVNGVATFPFQRIPGAFIQTGSLATFGPSSVGLAFCFLGGSPDGQTVAYRLQGLQPVRISTHAQEQVWSAGGFKVSDAVSYAYIDDGHTFWVINFWQQQQTWVYDMTENLWSERACWDPDAVHFTRYKAWYHVFIPEWGPSGKHIVGDPATGKLYEQNLNFYDDDGQFIEYLRAFPHLINEDKWSFHHRLEVYVDSGVQPSGDPPLLVGLDWSDDRGHTFAHNRYRATGLSGDYIKRVVFRRLGKSRDRVYRIGIQAKSKVALVDTFLEVTPGFA